MAFLTLLGTSWTWKGRAFVGQKDQGDVSKFTTILMVVRIQPPESRVQTLTLQSPPVSSLSLQAEPRPLRGQGWISCSRLFMLAPGPRVVVVPRERDPRPRPHVVDSSSVPPPCVFILNWSPRRAASSRTTFGRKSARAWARSAIDIINYSLFGRPLLGQKGWVGIPD